MTKVKNRGKNYGNRGRTDLLGNYFLSGKILFLHQNTPKNYRIRGLLGYLEQVNNDV